MRTLLFVFLTLAGCVGGGGPECIDNGGCAEGQACILEVCEDVQCLASTDCNIREYCDTSTYVCRAGCADDLDCPAGESCDVATNTCEAYGCRSSALDCSYGQVCNQVTGQCLDVDEGHCDRCSGASVFNPSGSCPDSSDRCLPFEQFGQAYCFKRCTLGQPDTCPRGYECIEGLLLDEPRNSYCFAACDLWEENGWK